MTEFPKESLRCSVAAVHPEGGDDDLEESGNDGLDDSDGGLGNGNDGVEDDKET